MGYVDLMKKATKDEILDDFIDVLNQIDKKPSDEIESKLQKIVYRIRPLIHKL